MDCVRKIFFWKQNFFTCSKKKTSKSEYKTSKKKVLKFTIFLDGSLKLNPRQI